MKNYYLLTIVTILIIANNFCFADVNSICSTKQKTIICKFSGSGNGLTKKILSSIEISDRADRLILEIKPGNYIIEPFIINRNNTTLYLDANVTLNAVSRDDKAWQNAPLGETYPYHQALINIINTENITLQGSSIKACIIDGAGSSWWHLAKKRPVLVNVENSHNINIHDITLTNSPRYHLSIHNSQDVSIYNINIVAPVTSPNTDGINMWTVKNIKIQNIKVQNGDDGIAINAYNGPSNNIFINNIILNNGHGLSIGSRVMEPVSNISVNNVVLNNSKNGLRIKTYCKSDLCNDTLNGIVKDVKYNNITMIGVKNPIYFDLNYGRKNGPLSKVKLKNISYNNVNIFSPKGPVKLICTPQNMCSNITFNNVNVDQPGKCQYLSGQINSTIIKRSFNNN